MFVFSAGSQSLKFSASPKKDACIKLALAFLGTSLVIAVSSYGVHAIAPRSSFFYTYIETVSPIGLIALGSFAIYLGKGYKSPKKVLPPSIEKGLTIFDLEGFQKKEETYFKRSEKEACELACVNGQVLPDDVLKIIFRNLQANELARVAQTCTKFRTIAQDDQFRKTLITDHFGDHAIPTHLAKREYRLLTSIQNKIYRQYVTDLPKNREKLISSFTVFEKTVFLISREESLRMITHTAFLSPKHPPVYLGGDQWVRSNRSFLFVGDVLGILVIKQDFNRLRLQKSDFSIAQNHLSFEQFKPLGPLDVLDYSLETFMSIYETSSTFFALTESFIFSFDKKNGKPTDYPFRTPEIQKSAFLDGRLYLSFKADGFAILETEPVLKLNAYHPDWKETFLDVVLDADKTTLLFSDSNKTRLVTFENYSNLDRFILKLDNIVTYLFTKCEKVYTHLASTLFEISYRKETERPIMMNVHSDMAVYKNFMFLKSQNQSKLFILNAQTYEHTTIPFEKNIGIDSMVFSDDGKLFMHTYKPGTSNDEILSQNNLVIFDFGKFIE